MPATLAPTLDPSVDPEVIAKHNAEMIAKVASQDAAGHTTVPSMDDIGNSMDALRKLRDSAKKPDDADPPVVAAKDDADPDKGTTPPVDDPNKGTTPPAETPEEKEAREKVEAEQAAKLEAERKAADELFKDSPSLPPNASVKSSDAFNAIKQKAAKEIQAREQQLTELRAKVEELSQAASKPLTKEVEEELNSLREFRAKLDVDLDPKFRAYDAKLTEAHNFIYAQLKRSPNITDETIEQIKKLGGPDQVKMDPILETIGDATIRRLVEGKLAEVELTRYEKQTAVEAAKKNVREYMASREKELEQGGKAHTEATKKVVETLLPKITWLQPKKADANATAEAKKEVEAHNAYAAKVNSELAAALEDDTPEMRATLLVGMAQLFRLQNVHEAVAKDYERVKTELDKANATIKRLSNASKSKLDSSAAPVSGGRKSATPEVNYGESAADALRRMMKEKQAAAQNS